MKRWNVTDMLKSWHINHTVLTKWGIGTTFLIRIKNRQRLSSKCYWCIFCQMAIFPFHLTADTQVGNIEMFHLLKTLQEYQKFVKVDEFRWRDVFYELYIIFILFISMCSHIILTFQNSNLITSVEKGESKKCMCSNYKFIFTWYFYSLLIIWDLIIMHTISKYFPCSSPF